MATSDKKISELDELITPSASDVLAIVNDSTTKKITVANLKAGILDQDITTTSSPTFATLFLDQNANLTALNIDTEATSADSINIDAVNTSGTVLDVNLSPGVASTATMFDFTNDGNCAGILGSITNNGTGIGLYINQGGVLADSGKNALYIYSNAIQTVGDLVRIVQDNASSTMRVAQIRNDGTGGGLLIQQDGVFALSTDYALSLYTNAIQTTGNLLSIVNDNASSTGNVVSLRNDGTGTGMIIEQVGNTADMKGGLHVYSTAAQSLNPLVMFRQANASTSGIAHALWLVQEGSADGCRISAEGTGDALGLYGQYQGLSAARLIYAWQNPTNRNFTGGLAYFEEASVVNDAGTYTKTNNIFSITSSVTETSGSITDSAVVLNLTQSHVHATGAVLSVSNAGTGYTLALLPTGNSTAGVEFIDNYGTGRSLYIYREVAGASSMSNFLLQEGHASNAQNNAQFVQGGTGTNLLLDTNGTGLGLYIDKDCTSNDTRTWAMAIDSDNAGTGTALGCGIDMSSFSVDEPILKAVADAITTAGTLSQQIAIDIGGTTYYLYAYTTGS